MVENEFYSDSFRALSAEKLGMSVLLLCSENDDSVRDCDKPDKNNPENEEE